MTLIYIGVSVGGPYCLLVALNKDSLTDTYMMVRGDLQRYLSTFRHLCLISYIHVYVLCQIFSSPILCFRHYEHIDRVDGRRKLVSRQGEVARAHRGGPVRACKWAGKWRLLPVGRDVNMETHSVFGSAHLFLIGVKVLFCFYPNIITAVLFNLFYIIFKVLLLCLLRFIQIVSHLLNGQVGPQTSSSTWRTPSWRLSGNTSLAGPFRNCEFVQKNSKDEIFMFRLSFIREEAMANDWNNGIQMWK